VESTSGPIIFASAAADGFTWAHSFFRQMLPMPSDGTISFSEAAADGFAWAQLLFQAY